MNQSLASETLRLRLLLSGKKPYASPDTTTFEAACGWFGAACACFYQAKSRTPLPIQQPLGQPVAVWGSLRLLLSGRKPYASPDTTTFKAACGCC